MTRLTFAVILALSMVVSVAVPVHVLAQQPPTTAAQDGFVPVDELPAQEQIPAARLVMTAYAIAWIAVFGYFWSIWRRLGRVERDMVAVSRRVETGNRP